MILAVFCRSRVLSASDAKKRQNEFWCLYRDCASDVHGEKVVALIAGLVSLHSLHSSRLRLKYKQDSAVQNISTFRLPDTRRFTTWQHPPGFLAAIFRISGVLTSNVSHVDVRLEEVVYVSPLIWQSRRQK